MPHARSFAESSTAPTSYSSSRRWGHLYHPRKYPKVRILLYGHYRVLYLPEASGDIYVLGIFHGALELKRHFKPRGQHP